MKFRRPIFLCITVALLLAVHFLGQSLYALTQFSEIAGDVHLNTKGDKDGGLSWGDFNNDGCLDLLVNTDDDTIRTRLYQSDCNLPDPSFTDVTGSHAAGLLNDFTTERSAIWGDVNNDGYLDFAVNTSNTNNNAGQAIKIFLNRGPGSFTFGDGSQEPNQIIHDISGGTNTEGLGWADIDQDDDLDLVIENHNFGIDIFINNGSGHFTYLDNSQTGLPSSAASGDYMAVTDFDADGDIDILARKENQADLWIHNGSSSPPFFSTSHTIDQAKNKNKGGVAFCDFDSDGDFDFFWTDSGTNQIWEQTGFRTGDFDARGFSADTDGNIDGVACGDVDNDGDMDLFLTSDDDDQLFINEGDFHFTRINFGIDGAEDGEGAAFGDYDRDGDLDLMINQDNENELWRNNSNDNAYLMVRAVLDVGDAERDAIGATAVLRDCSGNLVSGVREVNGGRGHGAQDPTLMHFGLAGLGGPDVTYVVEVRFVGGKTVHTAVVPGHISGYQQLDIRSDSRLNLDACQADLAISKSSYPRPAAPGQAITYSVVVHNLGPNSVMSLTLTDNMPAAIIPPYTVGAASGNYDPATGIWDHINLAADDTLTLTIVGTVDPSFSGTFENVASVIPNDTTDPNLDNNQATDQNQLNVYADLILHKAGYPNPVISGQAITYTLVVTNQEPQLVNTLTLTDNLPTGLIPPFSYVPSAGLYDPATGNWSDVNLGSGQNVVLTIVGTVDPAFTGTIINTANVSPIGATDPNLDNNQSGTSNQAYIPQITQPTPTVLPTSSPQPTSSVSPTPSSSPKPTATVSPVPSSSPQPTITVSPTSASSPEPTPTATAQKDEDDDNDDHTSSNTASATGGNALSAFRPAIQSTPSIPPLPVMLLPETGTRAAPPVEKPMGIGLSIRLIVSAIFVVWVIGRTISVWSSKNKERLSSPFDDKK
ncbi:MAG: VCBS repeat-containing protein [Anaerolineae bacterium]|nr:VCBS repeat-containing protein [Anaerolineae bacterium]